MDKNNLIKPKKLIPGDTIGIISPSGAVKETNSWESTVRFFENKGYKVKISQNAKNQKAYLAGTDEERLSDITDFFQDTEIKAILCSRGGYGTYRLLQKIDYKIIQDNPKIFVGYSDITALLHSFIKNYNLITFHGPLALSDFGTDSVNNYTESNFFEILEGKIDIPFNYSNPLNYECIKSGEAEGELIGGNLSILSGLLGTPFFPDIKNKILLLEDIGEPLYKIDRILMQLKLAGVFKEISGLLFGEFTNIVQSSNNEINKLSPINIIKELVNDIEIPIGYGFPAGHGNFKATLPLGIKYYFNSQESLLIINDDYLA